jgi:hypothetical protein
MVRIAATMASGIYLKYESNMKAIKIMKMLLKAAEILWVHPLLMFSVVRASAAVAGIPPANPEAILARLSPSSSLLWLCFVLVIPSAMRADIIVSKMAIIEIVNAGIIKRGEKYIWYGMVRDACRLENLDSSVWTGI